MEEIIKYIKEKVTFYKFFTGAVIIGVLVLFISTGFNLAYVIKNTNEIKKQQEKIEYILSDLKEDKKLQIQEAKEFDDFMKNYYMVQANWLNAWLMTLALIMAILGIMIPICFTKFFENQEKEVKRITEEAKRKIEEASLYFEKESLSTKEKSDKMTQDLKEVKDYVYEAKALSKYNEALNKVREDKDDEAKRLLEDAIKLSPHNDRILDLLGEISLRENRADDSLSYFLKAIEINPDTRYYYNLALVYSRKADHKKVVEILLGKVIDKNISPYFDALSITLLAKSYIELNNFSKALEYQNRALEIYQHPSIITNCAVNHIKMGNYDEAIKLLKQNMVIRRSARDYYNLTEAYIFSKQFLEALRTIKVYEKIQDKKEGWGIYSDDYDMWLKSINSVEETADIKTLKKIIDSLEKRPREYK